MAGGKHGRSGGSGGSEASPLAAQLQQAWLQTQMPKAQKRSFTSGANAQSQPSRLPSSGAGSELSARPRASARSALQSLSSLFPELANVPEEKKAMISSVFKDGEQPIPLNPALREKKTQCLGIMFSDNASHEDRISLSQLKPPRTQRSLSASVVQQSGGSSDYSDSAPFSTSHSFSGFSHRNTPESPEEVLSYPSLYTASSETPPFYDSAVEAEVAQEKTPMYLYYSDMLMDDKVEEKKCMFVEMSAYQAMAKELGDLISYDSSLISYDSSPISFESPPIVENSCAIPVPELANPEYNVEEDGGLDSWIDEILSGPLPAELRDSSESRTELGNKLAQSPEEPCSHSDSQVCSGSEFKDGKGTDSGESECQSAFPYVDCSIAWLAASGGSESSAYVREGGSAGNLIVDYKPIIPSSNGNGEHVPPVDLTNLLIRCAQAVEQSDFGHANELISELRQHSSAYGNGSQRMAHYFMEALVARMSGTGGQLYSALSNNRPSEAQMLKAQMLFCEHCPFIQVPHIFANSSIVEAFKGAPRVHIVDYGILYGVQWPCLLYQLSQRPEGPPHLRITGIDRPQPGFRPSARIQDTGRRLARLAKEMGVPFEFHAIAEKWEAITPAHLFLREDEVLAVNCVFRFRHLLDESVTAASPRNLVLSRIKSLNPKVFVQGVFNAGYNAPFFMSRFREALSHFSTIFDAMEISFPPESPDRQIIDHEIVGREILNVVACEGLERVERTETYRQWQARTMRAGFQQKPTSEDTLTKIKTAMKSYHRDYGIGEDGNWFLLGWKDHITHAMTIWVPTPDSP